MKKILSINDSIPIQALVAFTLGRQGHDVIRIFSEEDALHTLRHSDFDLIMLDITSRKIASMTILGSIKGDSMHAKTPVLTLTSRYCEDKTEEASRLGAADFLYKPFKPTELVNAASRLMEGQDRRKLGGET